MSYPGPEMYPRSRLPKLGVVLLVLVVAVVAVLVVRERGRDGKVVGQALPAAGWTVSPPVKAGPPVAPQEQPGWTTLSNPISGLSYQIPPNAGWTTAPTAGSVGQLQLTQGAHLSPYNCGDPANMYYRGELGSTNTPRVGAGDLATSIAQQAASSFYTSAKGQLPTVTMAPPVGVNLKLANGSTVSGVLVTARSHQTADPCLATDGEVDVLVLQLPDLDGVLLVNGDTAGGPATPVPATTALLHQIVASAEPIGG